MDRSGGRVAVERRFVAGSVADEVVIDMNRVVRRRVVVAWCQWEGTAQLLQLRVPQDPDQQSVFDWLTREQIETESQGISPTMLEGSRPLAEPVARLLLQELADQDP